jgi:cell division protein ZapE
LQRLQDELEAPPPPKRWFHFGTRPAKQDPRGVYLWGGVGRGKSMLMDLFIETLDIPHKRRVHFHAFMLEVDRMIAEAREKQLKDPIMVTSLRIEQQVRCLAFDEMTVTNTADAAIMGRLFTSLISGGVTIVTTSNRPPRDLYKDGLNRSLFVPFIELVEEKLDILPLNGPVDYRLERLGGMKTWHTPLGDEATAQAREAFFRLTDYKPEDAANVPSCELDVGSGRTLHVPKALKGVAVFSFKRLCSENRGAADYLAIASEFHTVIVVGIPRMGPEMRNEALRFTKLVDALYEQQVKLFATAEAEPEDLYSAGDGAFEFERTVSRLKEMQSAEYMARGHGLPG